MAAFNGAVLLPLVLLVTLWLGELIAGSPAYDDLEVE